MVFNEKIEQKPIFRVLVDYYIRRKHSTRKKKGHIDTFVLTDDIEEIKKDKEILNRICYLNKKKIEDVEIIIYKVVVENQYGYTSR